MRTLLLGILMLIGGAAHAQQSVFNVGYSTFMAAGISVTSGTPVQINATNPTGFTSNVAFYRITNNHPLIDIYVGDVNVSTDTVCPSCNPGHVLKAAGDYIDWPVNKDPKRASYRVPVYAQAANTTYVGQLPRLSVIWFGN